MLPVQIQLTVLGFQINDRKVKSKKKRTERLFVIASPVSKSYYCECLKSQGVNQGHPCQRLVMSGGWVLWTADGSPNLQSKGANFNQVSPLWDPSVTQSWFQALFNEAQFIINPCFWSEPLLCFRLTSVNHFNSITGRKGFQSRHFFSVHPRAAKGFFRASSDLRF